MIVCSSFFIHLCQYFLYRFTRVKDVFVVRIQVCPLFVTPPPKRIGKTWHNPKTGIGSQGAVGSVPRDRVPTRKIGTEENPGRASI